METVQDPRKIQPTDRDYKEVVAAAILEKRRRIAENGIKYYTPQDQQDPFHRSNKRIRAAFGANRSGKTVAGATEAVWYATGTHLYKHIPTPNFGRVICTDFTNGIEKVILPEIRRWMPKHAIRPGREGWSADSRTMYLKNGSTIEFMSYDQDVEKFASASRHWIWFDEEPPQNIFNECRMRLIDTRGDLWITMTPDKGMTWIYTDIYEKAGMDDNIDIFTFGIYDNPYIDNEEIEMIKSGLDEQLIQAKIYGKFVQLSGLIYKEYKEDVHNIPYFQIPYHWPRLCAIDPHPRIPTVVLYMAVAPVREFVDECKKVGIRLNHEITDTEVYVVYDEIYPQQPTIISEICATMLTKEGNDVIRYRLIDPSANTPDPIVGRTVKQEFEKHGIRTIIAERDVANRIFKVREKLQRNALYFMDSVPNARWEIRHYAWDDFKIGRDYKDPKEKPRKKRDHAMDDLGYMCASCPRYEAARVFRRDRKTADKDTGY